MQFPNEVFDEIKQQGIRYFAKEFNLAVKSHYEAGNLTRTIQASKLNSLVRILNDEQQWDQADLDQLEISANDQAILRQTVLQVVGLDNHVDQSLNEPPVADRTEPAVGAASNGYSSNPVAPQTNAGSADYETPPAAVRPEVNFNDLRGTNVVEHWDNATVRFAGGQTVVDWQHPEAGQWIYRIIATDDFNDEPEPGRGGEELGVTLDNYFAWEHHPLTFQNKVAIWRYPYNGGSFVDAPGEIHSLVSFTSNTHGLKARPSSGQINVSWDRLDGIYESEEEHDYTLVYRFDSKRQADRALKMAPHLFVSSNSSRLVATTRQHAFEDKDIRQGEQYVYVVINVAHDYDHTQGLVPLYSQPTAREAMLEMREEAAELTIEEYQKPNNEGELHDFCRVEYKKVPGETRIFQTLQKPNEDAAHFGQQGQTVLEDELEAYGLPLDAAVSFSQVEHDDVVVMESVGWPQGETKMYLTPVTKVNNGYIVGRSQLVRRVEPLQQLRVQQRLTWQLVTFKWPEGAHKVNIYQLPVDAEWNPTLRPINVVGEQEYKKESGVRLRGIDTTRSVQIVACGVSSGQSGEILGVPQSDTLEAIYPFSYSIAPYQEESLGQRAFGRLKNIFTKKTWYEVRVRYNGKEAIDDQHLLNGMFHLSLTDNAAALAPVQTAFRNYRVVSLVTSTEKDQGREMKQFNLPQAQPNDPSYVIGYFEVGGDSEVSEADVVRMRMMPQPEWRSRLPWPISLRRRAAHLLDAR